MIGSRARTLGGSVAVACLASLALACVASVALACLASPAGAVVVHTPAGKFLGIAPRLGVSPRVVRAAGRRPRAASIADNGTLYYQGGPILHSSTPYLIFWDPSSKISAASRSLLERYFTDVAADSGAASNGAASNVYGVARQFYDGSGFADYKQTFAAGQVINDTQPFPIIDVANCLNVDLLHYPNCLTDQQLQKEITRVRGASGLPAGLGSGAPIYFVVTPSDTNICAPDGSVPTPCADNSFCAYHSGIGSGGSTVLYAAIPMFFDGSSPSQDPKNCQADGYANVQEPNGNVADVALKALSHEDNETITDPTGLGWWDSGPPGANQSQYSGNEDGDNCNYYGAVADPVNGSSPRAFAPALGGDSSAGTLYDQLISGHHYYIQSEWSNGSQRCDLRPGSAALQPMISAPGSAAPGASLELDPTGSTSAAGVASETWDFGDGSSAFHGGGATRVAHAYASAGSYTVKLTLVDALGNLASTTRGVNVGALPSASFVASPSEVRTGKPIGFDASASSDPRSGVTLSYSWDFGDGTTAATSGPRTTHSYAAPGTYTVTLTVTDSKGFANSTSRSVNVAPVGSPVALIAGPSRARTGIPALFDGSGSNDPTAQIVSYGWSFSDGTARSTARAVRHTFLRPGSYLVALTVHAADGASATSSRLVTVLGPKLRTALRGRRLRITADQAGVVRLGSHRKRLRRAGTVSFTLALRHGQLQMLARRHVLKLGLKIVFVPAVGAPESRKLTVTLRS